MIVSSSIRFQILATCLFFAATAPTLARITTGPKPFEDRFADSDLVCQCVAVKVIQTGSSALINGRLPPANYEVTVKVRAIYKGASPSTELKIFYTGADPMEGPPLSVNSSYVLFLKDVSHGRYVPAEDDGAAVGFSGAEQLQTSPGGSNDLQSEMSRALNAATEAKRAEDMLSLLLQFRRVSPETVAVLEHTSGSAVPDVAVLSLEVLCHSALDAHKYLSRLTTELLKYQAKDRTSDLPGLPEIGSTLSNLPTNDDLPGLERLTDSSTPYIRQSAMGGIRKLRDPVTIPFLVSKLDSSDREIQYLAIITLAEVNGKFGDYGPGMGLFNKNPEKYVQLWKGWYRNQ